MSRARELILATRPWSFTMTAISVSLAAVASAGVRPFPLLSYLLTLAGMVLVHGATNLLNDYFDVRHGVDRAHSPTARYRAHPLLEGSFSPQEVLWAAIVMYGVAVVLASVLAAQRGWVVLAFVAVGAFASVFYTADPVRYKHLALGEISVFLMWGPLMMLATGTIVSGGWESAVLVLLLSVVQGGWVALVIFANNLKDIGFDRETAVRTLANLLGEPRARNAFVAALLGIYLLTGALILLRVLPIWGLAVILSLPASLRLTRDVARSPEVPADADPRTARAGMVFGLLLIGSFVVELLV